jgi:phosphatidate cytidylyltransferase
MARSETTQRLMVAAIGIPVAVGAVVLGGWVLAVLLAVLAALGTLEFYRMAATRDVAPLRLLGATLAAAFVALAAAGPEMGPNAVGFALLIVVGFLLASVSSIWERGVEGRPLLAVSVTLTGAIYAGALLSFGLFLRHLPAHDGAMHGTALVLFPVVLTWASDTFAYFAGRRWGTRKLIPRVSPGKTVQGAVGAVVGTVVVAIAYSFLLARFPTYRVGLVEAAMFGLLISVAAQVGDLVESLFKRDAGLKDSGTLFPGHGGVLDRLDSLFFTLPIAYLFFRYLVGSGVPAVIAL